jgi:four helix bundle protein
MGEKLRNHKDLDAWKESLGLVDSVYRATKGFPPGEIYGLVSQMRRAAVSVPSNIAEGAARASRKEFSQFLYMALGSLSELETQIIIARRLGYTDQEHGMLNQVDTVRRLLSGLIRHLRERVA